MFKKLILLSIIVMVAVSGLVAWANHIYNSPANYSETKHIIIEKGSGVSKVLSTLASNDVISNPKILSVLLRFKGQNNFKYGEYLFEPNLTPAQVFAKLEKGEVVLRKVTIPEGKTVYDILQILSEAEGLAGDIPSNIPEGSLLPQTYFYQWGDTYEDLVKQMQKAMQTAIDRAWEFRRLDIPIQTKEEAIILASIVEKETGGADERAMVASVFSNRLKIGMPLQSDPTAVYGITAGAPLGRLPSAADMRVNNQYNTYVIPALPPTPICNPGANAIEAVLNPADTDYLYFVANGMGGHNFSTSLTGHNKNVVEYRQIRREEKAAEKSSSLTPRQKSEMIIRPAAPQAPATKQYIIN